MFVVPTPRRGGFRAGVERSVPRRVECGGVAVLVSPGPAPLGSLRIRGTPRNRDAWPPRGSRFHAATAGGPESMAAAPRRGWFRRTGIGAAAGPCRDAPLRGGSAQPGSAVRLQPRDPLPPQEWEMILVTPGCAGSGGNVSEVFEVIAEMVFACK